MRRYALLGAEARLLQIREEMTAIHQAFPELRANGRVVRKGADSGRTTPASAKPGNEAGAGGSENPSRRRRMSAAQRKAVGERMKKYWAARRGGAQATPTTKPAESAPAPTAKALRDAKVAGRGAGKRGWRTMSAAARKRISEAQKKRWASQGKTT